jgi:hypothetical protein
LYRPLGLGLDNGKIVFFPRALPHILCIFADDKYLETYLNKSLFIYQSIFVLQNAAFLAKSLGIDIIDSVNAALSAAGYNNQTAKGVLIQSKDSAVLVKLKQQKTKCKLVYTLPSGIGDVSTSSLEAVKKFADAVVVDKDNSVFTSSLAFIIRQNNLMKDLQSAGLAVYAQVFRNEFLSQPYDFFADATVEINYYFQSFNLSGIITDFPKTVTRYKSKSHLPSTYSGSSFFCLHQHGTMKNSMGTWLVVFRSFFKSSQW